LVGPWRSSLARTLDRDPHAGLRSVANDAHGPDVAQRRPTAGQDPLAFPFRRG
jgi:hypothetical protein